MRKTRRENPLHRRDLIVSDRQQKVRLYNRPSGDHPERLQGHQGVLWHREMRRRSAGKHAVSSSAW